MNTYSIVMVMQMTEKYVTLDNTSRIYSYVFEVIGFSEKVVES